MALLLDEGEEVTIPPTGKVAIRVAADGTVQKTDSDGVSTDIGSGGGGGTVTSVAGETADAVDNTDPTTPILLDSTVTNAGTISAADKSKLDQITASADFITAAVPGGGVKVLTLSGLNGDAEGTYLVEMVIVPMNASQNIEILFNGANTNLNARRGDYIVGNSYVTSWQFGNTIAWSFEAVSPFYVEGVLSVKSGRVRKCFLRCRSTDATHNTLFLDGLCTETAANFTSIALSADNTPGLDVGTYIRLTPLYTNA